MSVVPYSLGSLGRRLKELREQAGLTQREVGERLRPERPLSPAQVSAWEAGKSLPVLHWALAYAEVLPPLLGSTAEESVGRLKAELTELREAELAAQSEASDRPGARPSEPSNGLGTFWRFPDSLPIRIIGTAMSDPVLAGHDYASRWHPNYIESLRNADMDATIELFGHLRAANPASDVRFLTTETIQRDDLTGHVILLGGADALGATPSALLWYLRRLKLPVRTQLLEEGDEEYDFEFVVRVDEHGVPDSQGSPGETYRPTFVPDRSTSDEARLVVGGYPQLEYDLGLLARQPNPMNLAATVTLCAGLFSRGTYGVVRALTDAKLREANERYLQEAFHGGQFWMLVRVPVFQGPRGSETVAPDFTRAHHMVRTSG
jgi:transcriptional regulator with XRE-family HTH domain